MNVCFDINVILDVMLDRKPFSDPASLLLSYVERGKISGIIPASAITTIHYLASKVLGKNKALKHINSLIFLFEIAPINGSVIKQALNSGFSDFEDAVLYYAGYNAKADAIVTRDAKGFKKSALPVYSPQELLKVLEAIE